MIILFMVVLVIGVIALIENNNDKENADLYQNEISLTDFKKLSTNEEDLVVYFYQTDCIYCKQTTPIVVPLAKEMDMDLKVFNLQEKEEGWNLYKIEGTPTIIHYKNGREISRVSGQQDKETFKKWFESLDIN